MDIKAVQLKRRDYWVNVRADQDQAPEWDYRVPAFTYEDNLVISWDQAYPGPYPTDVLPVLYTAKNLQDLADDHSQLHFRTAGLDHKTVYQVMIDTNRP
ncbi:hypothetical protein PUF88_06865 [Lactobacillaceae bacterium L1_55_11]|nr:hypothetical protein [Lactobacillaceae bacterium L1_55_11]